MKAIISEVPYEKLTQNTCYKVNYATIKSNSDRIIFGFDLGASFFIHAVLHAQDTLSGSYPRDNTNLALFM